MSQQDEQGYDNIYDKNISNIYIGKEMIERFKGSSLRICFNLRRVYIAVKHAMALQSIPIFVAFKDKGGSLTVDGTEQSITVTRGYNGANNRNYLDPNLISSIEIEKGLRYHVILKVRSAVVSPSKQLILMIFCQQMKTLVSRLN